MNLRQQIIEGHIATTAQLLNVDEDEAFVRLAHSLIVGESIHAFDADDLVDGGQDKQVDVITISEDGGSADVYILQVKNTESFSSNTLIQMGNGLHWIFEKPRRELATLSNQAFRDKIIEYRSVQSSLGPSNLRIHVGFVTNGLSNEISDEFKQELRSTKDRYSGGTFESFDVRPYGAGELVDLLNSQERQTRKIDGTLKIRYDANTPSLIRYHSNDLLGVVCSVPAQEVARLVNSNPGGSIFDLNIRRFLGERGAVNQDILSTCTSTAESYEFWFLNNGITIICDHVETVTDPDNPHLQLKNLQIVNGCQTATTLAMAQQAGALAPDVRVLVRVYQTSSEELVSRIVLTTNNQNKVTGRDLRANDRVQIDMEHGFQLLGYHYERKSRQYDSAGISADRIIANELAAQWYLAVVLRNPADARGRKYKIWGEHYNSIFAGGQIEPYIIAALLGRGVELWLKASGLKRDSDDIKRMLAKRGGFHVARIAAYLWRGSDNWRRGNQDELANQIALLATGYQPVEPMIRTAFAKLEEVIRSSPAFSEDIDRSLKSYALDEAITRSLHTPSGAPDTRA